MNTEIMSLKSRVSNLRDLMAKEEVRAALRSAVCRRCACDATLRNKQFASRRCNMHRAEDMNSVVSLKAPGHDQARSGQHA